MSIGKGRLMRLKKALLTKQDLLEQRFARLQRRLLEVQDAGAEIEKAMAGPVVITLDLWHSISARIDALRRQDAALRHDLQRAVEEIVCLKGQLRRTDASLEDVTSLDERKAVLREVLENVVTRFD